MKLKYLIFETDGVLFKSDALILESYKYAFDVVEKECPSDEKLKGFCGLPLMLNLRRTLGVHDKKLLERARKAFRAYHDSDENMGLVETYAGIPDALRTLCDQDITLFIATSKPSEPTENLLSLNNIGGYFEGVYGGDLPGYIVDKAAILHNLLDIERDTKGARMTHRNTMMVGGRSCDSKSAMSAGGFRTIGAGWGFAAEGELDQAGVIEVLSQPTDLIEFVERDLPRNLDCCLWPRKKLATCDL